MVFVSPALNIKHLIATNRAVVIYVISNKVFQSKESALIVKNIRVLKDGMARYVASQIVDLQII